eukprot:gene2705-3479_t
MPNNKKAKKRDKQTQGADVKHEHKDLSRPSCALGPSTNGVATSQKAKDPTWVLKEETLATAFAIPEKASLESVCLSMHVVRHLQKTLEGIANSPRRQRPAEEGKVPRLDEFEEAVKLVQHSKSYGKLARGLSNIQSILLPARKNLPAYLQVLEESFLPNSQGVRLFELADKLINNLGRQAIADGTIDALEPGLVKSGIFTTASKARAWIQACKDGNFLGADKCRYCKREAIARSATWVQASYHHEQPPKETPTNEPLLI